MAEIETGTQARQGTRGKPVLYVLIGSLLLLAVYMVGLLTWSGATAPPDHASQSQEAARATAAGSNSGSSSPSGSPSTNPNPPPVQQPR